MADLLCDRFNMLIEEEIISSEDIPLYIKNNLSKRFELRKYQIEALNTLIYYIEKYKKKVKPIHLLFNMATGSGKTLLMASNIIYLYEKGYRNFIFFVNSKNIIEKTKQNFLESNTLKYLFADNISINNKNINIRAIKNFDEADDTSINIIFTTIQGLHQDLNNPKEESVSINDFKNRKVVLLSDEAHHINTLTKSKLTQDEQEAKNSWEYTVNKVITSNYENILLEYTATIDTNNPLIHEKYKDKLIYKYDLKNYRLDGYSKEITVLRSERDVKDRLLQAVILSEYRRKVSEKNGLLIKPVMLIKSNSIKESKETNSKFIMWIEELVEDDILELKGTDDDIINKALNYFSEEDIKISDLIIEIKNNFSKDKCIEVNSNEESEAKQKIINNLEDKDNPYRVVFAVDMLNEGWDVLNLYDIVRVNEGRGSKTTTTREAQLIGRGARYCPFTLNTNDDKYKRKFDDDLDNDLRILENLYYHCINEPRYISDLKLELERIGAKGKDEDRIEVFLKLKDSFTSSQIFKSGFIFSNTQMINKNKEISSLQDMRVDSQYEYTLRVKNIKETIIMGEEDTFDVAESINRITIKINQLSGNIIRKAMDKNDFYKFDSLKFYFPSIKSINEFISSDKYLGGIELTINGNFDAICDLNNDELLTALLFVLNSIQNQINRNYIPKKGTKEFFPMAISQLKMEKQINITLGEDKETGKSMSINDGSSLRLDLSKEQWYAYEDNFGSSEEKNFILFMKEMYSKLKDNGFTYISLIRNEKIFRLNHFDDERVTEPDFILLMKRKEEEKYVHYQLLIECKGDKLLDADKWKEDLLVSVKDNYRAVLNKPKTQRNANEEKNMISFIPGDYDFGVDDNYIVDNEKYKIMGLLFYNKGLESRFRDYFKNVLNLV